MKTKLTQQNIPKGWTLIPAGDVFTYVKSYAFSRENLVNDTDNKGGIGNIHYGDIHSTFSVSSIDLKKVSVPMVKDAEFVPKPEDLLKDGDLIMADASEDYAGVGVTVSLHGLEDKKVVGGLHTFVLRDTKNRTDKYFRQYIFRNPAIRNALQKVANGVSVYSISKTALSKLPLAIPSLPEQKRIVSVLEMWDQAIHKLSQKIEKKKSIKKGLMQELLTGKTRPPGFKERWKVYELGELGEYYSGIIGKSKEDFGFGKPFVSYMNIYLNSKINTDIKDLVNITDDENQNKVKYGDLFFTTSSETPDEVGVASVLLDKKIGDTYLNSFCFGFRLYSFEKLTPQFAQYYFRSRHFRKSMFKIAQGASRFNLSKKYFVQIKIKIPKDTREQNAVAEILTTADKEIKTLEHKLKTIQEQKQYLLKNLITGTIRIPELFLVKK